MTQYYLGISAGFHDAAAAVIDSDGRILFAGHSERYSKLKNDPELHPDLIREFADYEFDTIAFYERPWMHNIQQWVSGQKRYQPWSTRNSIRRHLGGSVSSPRAVSFPHHLSHAAAGFQTSPFQEAAVVVIDAIGELDTVSIYRAWYDSSGRAQYKRLWVQRYPHSIGLFYSAITQAVGLKPLDEEYITMGMAAHGSRSGLPAMREQFVDSVNDIRFKQNLHLGIADDISGSTNPADIAGAAQALTEDLVHAVMSRAQELTGSLNLVYMGGVALNCVINSELGQHFDRIWIMPNPGDAGSGLGAAALAMGQKLNWCDAYLGHDIPGPYPVAELVDKLITDKIVGVASGRAEWGPRALGNRSLLADPRGTDIKDRVNKIKQRQRFRPFAPVILEELAADYFAIPRGWDTCRYMQSIAICRRPDLYPAVCHVDGTSRVQTVPQDGSGIRRLLEHWYSTTGCPMLLNTSLNVRGEPMVNDSNDANRFETLYGITVCS